MVESEAPEHGHSIGEQEMAAKFAKYMAAIIGSNQLHQKIELAQANKAAIAPRGAGQGGQIFFLAKNIHFPHRMIPPTTAEEMTLSLLLAEARGCEYPNLKELETVQTVITHMQKRGCHVSLLSGSVSEA